MRGTNSPSLALASPSADADDGKADVTSAPTYGTKVYEVCAETKAELNHWTEGLEFTGKHYRVRRKSVRLWQQQQAVTQQEAAVARGGYRNSVPQVLFSGGSTMDALTNGEVGARNGEAGAATLPPAKQRR